MATLLGQSQMLMRKAGTAVLFIVLFLILALGLMGI